MYGAVEGGRDGEGEARADADAMIDRELLLESEPRGIRWTGVR